MATRRTGTTKSSKDQPFAGLKVYYSGSIRGVPEADPNFPWQLVQYMAENGADVLSEHVAARTQEEMWSILSRRSKKRIQDIQHHPKPWFAIRKIDTEWVDEATHVVALVNSPSHGVGMEIERALLKPERGLPFTPILCLIKEDLFDKLTNMIKGIKQRGFFLKTYADLSEAQKIIYDFLRGKL